MPCAKFYLVPEEIVDIWKSRFRDQNVDRPVTADIHRVAHDMTRTLHNEHLSPDEMVKVHGQQLGEYLVKRKLAASKSVSKGVTRKNLHSPTVTATAGRHPRREPESLIDSLSWQYRDRATDLLRFLRSPNVGISFDRDSNEIIVGGKQIEGSNFHDLFKDKVVTTRRHKPDRPVGFEVVKQHLLAKNVPIKLLGNTTWLPPPPLSQEEYFEDTMSSDDISSSDDQESATQWENV